VNINVWPESGPVMDVRRYSNYPHLAQGESAWDDPHWVEKTYYGRSDRECFAGVSKTHEMLLYFHGPNVSAAAIDSLAADFQSPALVYAGARWYAEDTKVILPTLLPGDSQRPEATANIDRGAEFLKFHKKYWNWYGSWDYGDVPHMFKRGYGATVPAKDLEGLLKLSPEERKKLRGADTKAVHDYWPQHDWAYDNGRWGWSNSEGLTGMFMQLAYLRTGDRDLYFFSEGMARHARDVDIRHLGGYFGYGTRHGVQHWSDGNHEHRQTFNGEFRYNYFLSGDMRSSEFAQDLTDNYYMVQPVPVDYVADHGARMYGLLFAWERTHNARYAETLKNYIHAVCPAEGIDVFCGVTFPDGKRIETPNNNRRLNDGSFFFQYFGAMHALLEYYELTRDETLRQSMVAFAKGARGDMLSGHSPVLAMGFAARYADDKDEIRKQFVERLTASRGVYGLVYGTWPKDQANWTGPTAPATHFPCAMFWLNSAGYVLGALEKEPPLNPEQQKLLQQMGQYTGPLERGQPTIQIPVKRESWQNGLDDPALKSYTTPKRALEP